MKRRILALFCLICVMMCFLRFPVYAAETSGECGSSATWSVSDDGVLTISGSGAIRDYIYEGANSWPNIKAPWREHAAKIKKVVISSGITRIGDNAFCMLKKATSVSIPGTVTSIGQSAFADMKALTKITLPNSVKTVGMDLFIRCSSLKSVKLPSGLKELTGGMFISCAALKTVELPKKITVIQGTTFEYAGLTSITIPDGVTTIETEAFQFCSKLKSVKLPGSLKEIGLGAFEFSGLTSVTIPKKVTHLVQGSFGECHSLKTIRFEGSAPQMDSHIFSSVTAKAYYPKDNPSWTAGVLQDYGGDITWIGYCGNGHSWGPWETARETTCAKEGLKIRSCGQCDMTEEESIEKLPHQYSSVVTPPTCKDAGFTTHTCSICGDSYKDSKTKAGPHAYGEWVVTKEATCLEKGSRQRSCIACEKPETEELELTGHNYREEVTPPSCTQDGFTTHTCSVCGDSFTDTPAEKTGHTFGDWIQDKPATWKEEGLQHRTCQNCPETQEETLAKLPINWGVVAGVPGGAVAVIAIVIALVLKKKRGK